MKRRYRISPQGLGPEPSDAELRRYRDAGRLLHNYQRARDLLHRRPLYRDRRAFLALLLVILIAWLASEASRQDRQRPPAEAAPRSEAPGQGAGR